jgi:RNA polymerase sigma factor (sigma-70 family)
VDDAEFERFLASVRNWNPDDIATFFRLFEPDLRRKIRARLREGKLSRAADSGDVSQSVLFRFLLRATEGKYEIESPKQLRALLWKMARNRISDLSRHEKNAGHEFPSDLPAPGSSPGSHVEREDSLAEFQKQLSAESRQVHQWRNEGLEWDEIGKRLGKPPQAVRIRLAR